jgi:hypothetical protein
VARAAGAAAPSGQRMSDAVEAVTRVVDRLEALASVNGEAQLSVFAAIESGDEPDYAAAYQAVFAAVALLDPAQAAQVIRRLLSQK